MENWDWHVFCFAVPLTRRNALAREHDHEFSLKRMTVTNPSSKTEYRKNIFPQETKEKTLYSLEKIVAYCTK